MGEGWEVVETGLGGGREWLGGFDKEVRGG